MDKGRLEAFSDGVIAIIITITALLIEPPKGATFDDLKETLPLILVYTVSFIMIGTNWANHHHLLKLTEHINGKVIWANHVRYILADESKEPGITCSQKIMITRLEDTDSEKDI